MARDPRRDTDTLARLATWLRDELHDTGRTPSELAGVLGVGAATVRAWLRGTTATNPFADLDTTGKLGAWLRARITESGLSVKELTASLEHVSAGSVYNWCKGEHLPPPPTGSTPDRFYLLLCHPDLALEESQRLQLDEVRRRLTGTSTAVPLTGAAAPWPTAGLPADTGVFTGRGRELRSLNRLLSDHTRDRTAVICGAVTGLGGVGKTTLAVHWARSPEVAATFPDGCVHIDLNGYAETPPLGPEAALALLLRRLDTDPVPGDTTALSDQYQRTLAGRRLLILLDNAHDEAQVRPLLATESDCLTVITSRNRLSGLDVTGGRIARVPLDTFTPNESRALIRNLLGGTPAPVEDVDALARFCGHLPLAIRVAVANHLTHHRPRGDSLADYLRTVADHGPSALATGPCDPDTAVASVLGDSYRHLSPDAQTAYRLLGTHPGADFGIVAAASLSARPVAAAHEIATELIQANLLADDGDRHRFHDLVRDHAAATCAALDPPETRRAATRRLLHGYLHTAHAAAIRLSPARSPLPLKPPAPGAVIEPLADADAARTWFAAEHANLAALIDTVTGFDVEVWQLAWTLIDYYDRHGHWRSLIALGTTAATAADNAGDLAAEARMHRMSGLGHFRLRQFDAAETRLRQALDRWERADDLDGMSNANFMLGGILSELHDYDAALSCLSDALDLSRRTGQAIGEIAALNAIGWVHTLNGDHRQAVDWCQRALEVCRHHRDANGEASTWDSLGLAYHRLGEHHHAREAFEEALSRFSELGDQPSIAEVLPRLADTQLALADPAAARDSLRRALTVLTELDHPEAAGIRDRLAELDASA